MPLTWHSIHLHFYIKHERESTLQSKTKTYQTRLNHQLISSALENMATAKVPVSSAACDFMNQMLWFQSVFFLSWRGLDNRLSFGNLGSMSWSPRTRNILCTLVYDWVLGNVDFVLFSSTSSDCAHELWVRRLTLEKVSRRLCFFS